ncbi:MAG TPA: hypothetical protein PK431_14720 [Chitinophagales bacterium]|nr:hypothetical protein [Chitinophagales bacterium]
MDTTTIKGQGLENSSSQLVTPDKPEISAALKFIKEGELIINQYNDLLIKYGITEPRKCITSVFIDGKMSMCYDFDSLSNSFK